MNSSIKRNSWKKIQILSTAVALALTSAAVYAQAQQAAPDRAKAGMRKLDLNNDGAIDRAEAANAPRLAARFDQLDINKDGKLSATEHPQMSRKHRRGANGGHDRMVALDTDKDSRISRTEAQSGQGKLAGRFDQMDINKDGYLDRADRQARIAQQRAEFFKGADANHDGRVTRDEFIVEQGARAAERRERHAQREQAAGKQMTVRQAPTEQQQIEFAGKAFDRMDANKDGALMRAELDASKPDRAGRDGARHGQGESKMGIPAK